MKTLATDVEATMGGMDDRLTTAEEGSLVGSYSNTTPHDLPQGQGYTDITIANYDPHQWHNATTNRVQLPAGVYEANGIATLIFSEEIRHNHSININYEIDGTGHETGGTSCTSPDLGGYAQPFGGRIIVPTGKTALVRIGHYVTFGAESVELNTITLDITHTADYTDDTAITWPAAAPWPANP